MVVDSTFIVEFWLMEKFDDLIFNQCTRRLDNASLSLFSIDDLLSKVFLKKFWGDRHGFKFVMSSESSIVSLKLPKFGKLSF